MRAFIIEDEYLIARSIQDRLEDLGFNAFSFARSEDAAVVGARSERIDLITADVRLVPGDGLDAVEAICATRNVPVVFITGYAAELEEGLENRLPAAEVLQKPLKENELEEAVKRVLRAAGKGG